MSDQSSEPEKYTIDDMIDRLKERDSTDDPTGELVTRADGTQAMKVRKRRRRTDQTATKESKRSQRLTVIRITSVVVLVVVAGLVAGIGMLYANSVSFRDGLTAKTEAASGAKADFNQFRMNPATANSNAVLLDWPSGNVLHNLALTSLVAKVSPASFLGKTFQGEEITARKGELILRTPVAGEPARYASPSDGPMPLRFSRYSVPLLDIYFGGERRNQNMLAKTEASLFPGNIPGQAEIRLNGGLLALENWPTLELDRSYMKVVDSNLEIKSLRFAIPAESAKQLRDRGHIDFSGTIKPLEAGATHVLAARLESFRLSYLLGADLGRFFIGNMENKDSPESNFLKLNPGSGADAVLELSVGNAPESRIDVRGFKFLSLIAEALEDNWYGSPTFDDNVSFEIRRVGGLVEMKKFNMVNRGKIALRGRLSNGEGGQIKGVIMLGLPATSISSTGNKTLEAMFGEEREGYRWVNLEIGGTGQVPTDNFLKLYQQAKNNLLGDPAKIEPGNDSFEGLTAPE